MQGPHFLEILHQDPHGTIDALGVLWIQIRGIRLLAGGELFFQNGQPAHDRGPQPFDDVLNGATAGGTGFLAARFGLRGGWRRWIDGGITRTCCAWPRARTACFGRSWFRLKCRTSRRLSPTYGFEIFKWRRRWRGRWREAARSPLPPSPFCSLMDIEMEDAERFADFLSGYVRRLPGDANSLPIRRSRDGRQGGLGH
jgi:hypothetical protein